MSAATASVADVSRTDFTNRDNSRVRKNTGHPQAQCTPMPLPALGTQRIIQGNGTNVGTVISLQCPAKHKLVGNELTCVLDNNSPHWVGETYCKPLSPYEDYGFRVAVLASIISSGIILLMSMAFITCCLLDCIKENKRKKEERESDVWHFEEQEQHRDDSRSHYSHKGRNNNNNNTQEKAFPLWDTGNPAMCDNIRPCRCQQQYVYGPPSCNYGPLPPLAALPGLDYEQPLLPRNLDYCPPQYPGPPLSSSQTTSPIPLPGSGVVWQYGRQHSRLSEANPPLTNETSTRNINSNRNINPKELSIRIISV
ncbi:sushi domain-containing protein 3 [Melanotaenia boesemani]|uniref:sushi domain-containing protein 3 n=1 Tax=Melanotaenia boesemani TaxID=1250792 RepID=UPI001C03B6F8|nr:sushi domain-containing protein 3 [Melanotaenia boesemani]